MLPLETDGKERDAGPKELEPRLVQLLTQTHDTVGTRMLKILALQENAVVSN
jgi:hypothetical protein